MPIAQTWRFTRNPTSHPGMDRLDSAKNIKLVQVEFFALSFQFRQQIRVPVKYLKKLHQRHRRLDFASLIA